MKKLLLTLITLLMMSTLTFAQMLPSASVPEADSRPLQVFTTALQITVRDNLGNIQDSAKVQIFHTKEDYQQETNPIGGVQYTDKKGRIKYTALEPKAYYVNVEKGDMNNYGAATLTDQLTPKRNNKVTIIIE